ncbi:MAG: hypothetical protein SAK29_28480 [Scytonema sp. PMC 1069.18]|nr:hypothetical protein [Scytonema sp. PMC 1069.18]MEC4880004.1 hypothetical protein [Scytonema sp. PMC 1070.18]
MYSNMERSLINASLSTENLTFRRGSSPVSFEVTVNNDSDQFANFQLEVSAPGENRSSGYSWYKLSPEVAAAQPHGSSTQFQVSIFDTPLPGFVGIINLTVKVFSPQLRQQRRLLLRLNIEPDGGPTLLSVELPVRDFQVYPRNTVDIPVQVRNLGQQPINVTLRFAGIDPLWLVGGAERRLSIDPGTLGQVNFQCQPPSVVQAPSQNYPFAITATGNNSVPAKGEGNLEVLPIGFVEFSVPKKHQKIPSKAWWVLDWKSNSAIFELGFKNASNLKQQVNVQIQGRDWRKCVFKTEPQDANLNIGETTKVFLDIKTKRPWVGIGKTLVLEAKPELFDQRLGSTDPATQILELEVLPIIPLWLQMAVLALLAALLALLFRPVPVSHTDFVQAVRISGDVLSVVSVSDDCTIRRWKINANVLTASLEPEGEYRESPFACNQRQQPRGLLAIPNQPVLALRFMPVDNNRVAIGLKNGVIQLWNIPNRNKRQELKDINDPTGDIVFDLVYTKDSQYLFSGHGSGKVRVWSSPSQNSDFRKDPVPPVIDLQNKQNLPSFQVRALALSPDEQTLAIAGQFKRFVLWDWKQALKSAQPQGFLLGNLGKLGVSAGQDDYVFGLAFAPLKEKEILATADSGGFITIWDVKQCKSSNSNNNSQDEVIELNCQPLDRWEVGNGAVSSVAFNEDGSLLVSGGDDGRVVVWFLTSEYKLDKAKAAEGQAIYQSSKKINTLDVKTSNEEIMIVSGSDDFQVKLNRLPTNN